MAWLARSFLVCLLLPLLSLGCLPPGVSAMGLPKPPPNMNFTIAVEGAVLCRSCPSKNASSPLSDAVVLLRCRREEWALSVTSTADGRGNFHVETAKQVKSFKNNDCHVYVLRSPEQRACGVAVQPPRNKGLQLKFRKFVSVGPDGLQALYKTDDFVFGPKNPGRC